MKNEISNWNEIRIYNKKTQVFTIVVSCVCSILVLATPYRMDVYYWTCSKHFHWLLYSIFPLIFVSLVLIIISSLIMTYKKNTTFEILLIVSSIIGIPSVILGDLGQFIFLLCGPFQPVYLPTTYFALAYFLFMAIWGSILLTRKKTILIDKSM